jgi:repressor LexA
MKPRRQFGDASAPREIEVRLSQRDRDLIVNHTYIGGDVETRVRVARSRGKGIVVYLSPEDLEDLIGHVAAAANHAARRALARQLYGLYDRLAACEAALDHGAAPAMGPPVVAATPTSPRFTRKQGQYLAFIYYYTKLHGLAPAEAELQAYFKVTPPSVHQMILTLEARGLISREPGKARSVRLLVPREALPDLE